MNKIDVINITMNKTAVGKIVLTADGLCAFEYDINYIQSGVSISPYFLPLKTGVFVAKHNPFGGNFGVFDDSLPDGWGSLLLDRYLKKKSIDADKLTKLERLSLIGSTGRGALEYSPNQNINSSIGYVDFDNLAKECEKILTTEYNGSSLDTLYQYGSSSGGARPKIFIKIDDKEWLIKFKATNDLENIGETEYQYSLLAKKCGIKMAETHLFDNKYFGVERFDRANDLKIHTISAGGLLNADFRIPSLDYSILLKLTLQLTKDIEQVYDMLRIMIFNILISNRDDHAKNFSFQLIDNLWKLSPAYDLLPSNGFNGYHTTTINGNGDPTIKDVLEVANSAGLNIKRTKQIIEELVTICEQQKMTKYNLK